MGFKPIMIVLFSKVHDVHKIPVFGFENSNEKNETKNTKSLSGIQTH